MVVAGLLFIEDGWLIFSELDDIYFINDFSFITGFSLIRERLNCLFGMSLILLISEDSRSTSLSLMVITLG